MVCKLYIICLAHRQVFLFDQKTDCAQNSNRRQFSSASSTMKKKYSLDESMRVKVRICTMTQLRNPGSSQPWLITIRKLFLGNDTTVSEEYRQRDQCYTLEFLFVIMVIMLCKTIWSYRQFMFQKQSVIFIVYEMIIPLRLSHKNNFIHFIFILIRGLVQILYKNSEEGIFR